MGACHLGVGSTTEEIVEVADGAALNEIGRRQLHSELSLDSIAQGDQAQRVDTQHARHIRFRASTRQARSHSSPTKS